MKTLNLIQHHQNKRHFKISFNRWYARSSMFWYSGTNSRRVQTLPNCCDQLQWRGASSQGEDNMYKWVRTSFTVALARRGIGCAQTSNNIVLRQARLLRIDFADTKAQSHSCATTPPLFLRVRTSGSLSTLWMILSSHQWRKFIQTIFLWKKWERENYSTNLTW